MSVCSRVRPWPAASSLPHGHLDTMLTCITAASILRCILPPQRHAQLFVLIMTLMAHTMTFVTYAIVFALIYLAFDQPM